MSINRIREAIMNQGNPPPDDTIEEIKKLLDRINLNYLEGLTSNVQAQLANKQNILRSGANIKTINNQSILGGGNLEIAGDSAEWGNIDGDIQQQTDLWLILQSKQDDLVSGVNIKTINSQSILGPGNIDVSGGSPYTETLVAYRTEALPSGGTMTLSTDGTGITGLIVPEEPYVGWNVRVETIATVTDVIGDVMDVAIGSTYSESTSIVFKAIGGLSTIVAIVSSEAGYDTSMTTSTMLYSIGGVQNLNLQFQFPIFVGSGTVEISAVSKVEIVKVTYNNGPAS